MNVTYTAPNRAHHYRYASALNKAGILHSFVSGFSRFSPRARFDEIGNKLYRADTLQTLYLSSLRAGLPAQIAADLAYLSKIEQDFACKQFIDKSDIFLFYNGSGLSSCRYGKKRKTICIVEAVNSHVSYQEELLAEEHQRLKVAWTPFHKREKERRIAEYELADYILLPSEFVKKSFVDKGFPEHKLLKVPYGFESLAAKAQITTPASTRRAFTVLYVGNVSIRKGVRYLIQAFTKLQHPNKKLVIVGPVTNTSGLRGIDVSSQITFTGVLKGEALQKAYADADVFCLPSIEEGLALVLGEALSFGLPIIATVNTGASDIITDGREGFIVPIRDPDGLFEKLQVFADDENLRLRMQASARAKSEQLNGWAETGQHLVSTLRSVTTKY